MTMTTKPRLLDLFCGAGGAAVGYDRVGFDVTGIDNQPQPHYPFTFILADALEYARLHGHEFDAIHASPPCQHYTRLRHLPWLRNRRYWRSVPPTREALMSSGTPWVIENVADCWDLPDAIVLCGQMFGLPIFRHRRFEASFLLLQPGHQKHRGVITPGRRTMAKRYSKLSIGIIGEPDGARVSGVQPFGAAMGIDWMNRAELTQAIPPVFTEFVGQQFLQVFR